MSTPRKEIARLARTFYENKISFNEFLSEIPEQAGDKLIDELIDLIEHEPKKGGFLGVKKKEHEQYVSKIFSVIERLENEAI